MKRFEVTAAGTHVAYERGPRASEYEWDGAGPLSVKVFPAGSALYETNGALVAARPREFLILNDGQHYVVRRPPAPLGEALLVFFDAEFAGRSIAGLTASDAALVDDPDASRPVPEFVTRSHPYEAGLAPRLERLRRGCAAGELDALSLGEGLHGVLAAMLTVHQATLLESDRLPAARRSTRLELYRRLYRAREYAAARFDGPVTIGEIARAACLSESHMLRGFRRLFGETPHQYVTRLRIDRARDLLRRGERPPLEVCLEVGFESLPSFYALFKKRVGIPPGRYRSLGRRGARSSRLLD